MDDKVLRKLEYNKIIEMLLEYAQSDMGKALVSALRPYESWSEVVYAQQQTDEAEQVVHNNGGNPLTAFDDVRPALSRSKVGGVLSPRELLQVAQTLRLSREIKARMPSDNEQYPCLCEEAEAIQPAPVVENEIFQCIIGEDELADNASSELARIRKSILRTHEKIREKLQAIIHSPTYQKILQEPIITIRNDRYVVPVKQEFRGQLQGLIHDQSASGATLFIEPMAAVDANNDLRQLMAQEKAEIERILKQLSTLVSEIAEPTQTNLLRLAQLDFIFAKGCLSRRMRAVSPKLNQERRLRIKQGRHPLIAADKVVPIDIHLGETFHTLVITGPNTGGKTVTLKTVGLFTLMAQAGLHVPADNGTELAVFEEVFADIGDEQSIEQSLSTFSSHMTNIVAILRDVSPQSLVLLDELGAGTDPVEGAALAQAILQHLHGLNARTLATTHYSELKAFALSAENVENASIEFNIETLRPTYRLFIGIPGRSNALEISSRLGLSEKVVESARGLISAETLHFEDVLESAEYHRQIAEKERAMAEEARKEIVELQNRVDEQRKQLAEQKDRILRQAREEAKRLLNRARAESEEMIQRLQRMTREMQDSEKQRIIMEERQKLKSHMDEIDEALQPGSTAAPSGLPPLKSVKVGEAVLVADIGQHGTVLTLPDSKGEVQVLVGIMKVKTPLANLRQDKQDHKPIVQKSQRTIKLRDTGLALEVDVRGRNLDEAMPEVEKYLDDVVIAGLEEVSIIHGKGTGALRAGIHAMLKSHRHVASYRLGKYGEGESGVTIVEMKK